MKMPTELPRPFISYAWESDSHRQWVKELAMRLRADGVACELDQWSVAPGDQLPAFMERAIRDNSHVLIVCTPAYKAKSESRVGGVGYEGDIMSAEVLTSGNHRKFIPVLRSGDPKSAIPSWLAGKYFLDFRSDPIRDTQYLDLIATLFDEREKAPPIKPRTPATQDIRSGGDEMALEPIRIIGIVADEVSVPRNDGTPGSALYRVPFRLSRRPSTLWAEAFVATWNRPPSYTSMHRPGIARVVGNQIVLDGTTLEEVERYHRDTLKLCVPIANQVENAELARIERERLAITRMEEDHRQRAVDAANRIRFDDDH